MSERISNRYQPLFEIQILHHYWLDDGAVLFDLLESENKKNERLLSYDCRSFFDLAPTAGTAKVLSGLGCIYKSTPLGCIVAIPDHDHITVPVEPMLEFVLTVRDPDLFNYTAFTLRSQRIHEIYYQPENKTYRYKENVLVLSNLTGTMRDMELEGNTAKTLFLSKEFPELAIDDQVESFFIQDNALKQLTDDQLGADTQELAPEAVQLPVFVHQGDVPIITPPDGLTGAPERGLLLSDDIPDDIFALIRLAAIRQNDGNFSFIGNNGKAKKPCPLFQVRFKNRSTFWRYFNSKKGKESSGAEPIAKSNEPLPLTHFGNAGIKHFGKAKAKQKPSKGLLVKVEKNGSGIIKLVSEIFI